eukprot:m.161190 g.161190  ORF g.161190 m.161190 type:complete len:104 (+) comp17637_c0_seq5:139-450(+)
MALTVVNTCQTQHRSDVSLVESRNDVASLFTVTLNFTSITYDHKQRCSCTGTAAAFGDYAQDIRFCDDNCGNLLGALFSVNKLEAGRVELVLQQIGFCTDGTL